MDDNLFIARFEGPYRAEYNSADPAGFTALDFVGALGSIGNALLYSRLFLPQFVEVDGMVFIKDFVDDIGGPDGVRKRCADLGDRRSVEKSINHFDVNLSFPNHLDENVDGDDLVLAIQIAKIWGLRLEQQYSNRKFLFDVHDDNGSPYVSFFEGV